MITLTILRIFKELGRKCSDGNDRTQRKTMLNFKRWLSEPIKTKIKKRTKINEPRSNQTHGEGGNVNQQRQAAGSYPQVTQQTVHLFPMPKL